jgi:hypothetical protein
MIHRSTLLIATAVVAFTLLARPGDAVAQLVLKPSAILPTKAAATSPVSGTALKFDLSQIPKGSRVDFARLSITVNADTTLGRWANVIIKPAENAWESSLLPTLTKISVIDSLAESQAAFTGDGKSVIVDLTDLVDLWYTGKLANNGIVMSITSNATGAKAFAIASKGAEVQATLSVFFSK